MIGIAQTLGEVIGVVLAKEIDATLSTFRTAELNERRGKSVVTDWRGSFKDDHKVHRAQYEIFQEMLGRVREPSPGLQNLVPKLRQRMGELERQLARPLSYSDAKIYLKN